VDLLVNLAELAARVEPSQHPASDATKRTGDPLQSRTEDRARVRW
jgi:hypothetical protein